MPFPILFCGFISGLFSYLVSFTVTSEILRNNYYNHLEGIRELRMNNSKVKFKNEVNVLLIPSFRSLSKQNIKELWYQDEDFNRFKVEFIENK